MLFKNALQDYPRLCMAMQAHQHDRMLIADVRIVRIQCRDFAQHLLCLRDSAGSRQHSA